jgi:hypothetical protein
MVLRQATYLWSFEQAQCCRLTREQRNSLVSLCRPHFLLGPTKCSVLPVLAELSCSLKSRQRSSVGKPNIILGNGEVFLARLTNRLGRRSNAVPDDFINRFAGRTEIKVILRCGRHGTRASSSISLRSKRKGAGDLPAPSKLAHPLVTTGGGGGALPLPTP